MHVLHDSRLSGNAWKVRILLSQLQIPYRRVTHVLADGTTRKPEFLARHPLGKVPVLECPTGEVLFESNAILCHLAEGTEFLPRGVARSKVMQWLFFDQSEAMKPLGAPRFWISIAKRAEEKAAEIAAWHASGNKVLAALDAHLAGSEFMVADRYTIADIALFPYVSLAGDGGYQMERYRNVQAWIGTISRVPRHVGLVDEGVA